jgi:hypothetical protein
MYYAFNGVDPRIVVVVRMTRPTALLAMRVLDDEETAAAVLR